MLSLAAAGLTKRRAVGCLLRSLIMFQTLISRHNSTFLSDKMVLTYVFFFSSRRRHTRSVSAFLLNRSSDLIRHHDYDQCFQSVQLLQWNSQVKFNVTVYRNLPTTRDSIMTS